MKKIKEFIVANGFTSLLVLAASVVALILGFKGSAAILFGVFIGRNWEIIKKLYNDHVKEKLKDAVADVTDRF